MKQGSARGAAVQGPRPAAKHAVDGGRADAEAVQACAAEGRAGATGSAEPAAGAASACAGAAKAIELVVGSGLPGAYASIAAALAALAEVAPDEAVPVVVRVAPGTYRERVEIRRPRVTIEGETAESVRIVGGLGALDPAPDGGTRGTFRTYTVLVDAAEVTLRNLTIENDAGDGREVGQAIALYADGDRLVVDACEILGHQDTLFCGPLPPREVKPGGFVGPKQFAPRVVGRQYYRRCRIAGDVDFIFGGACAYFEGCEIVSLDRGTEPNGYVTAASTPEGEPYGFVFHGCSFTSEAAAGTVYVGRPWREWAQTVLVDCWLGAHIAPSGWFDWNKPAAHERSFYAASGLVGPGGTTEGWERWTHVLPESERARFARERVLAGAGGWDPEGASGDAVEVARLSAGGRTVHEEAYFEDEQAMRERFRRTARSQAFAGTSKVDWLTWHDGARRSLAESLGLASFERAEPCARELERVVLPGGIERRRMVIQTEPGVWMPFYLLYPRNPKRDAHGRARCWLCPHGHQGAGAASVAGLAGVPAVDAAIRRFNYDYGLRLARMGYVTVCPDARGWGARRDRVGQGDDEQRYLRGTCAAQAHMTEPLGCSAQGGNVWDLMRLIDWLASATELALSIDTLGCLGFSGGGAQALYLAALDHRVSRVFISGYLYGFEDALLHLNGNCACNYVPGLWRLFDAGDIASLIAPRPLVVQSCAEDHLNGPRGMENVYEQVNIVRRAYELLGCGERLRHEVCPGEHHLGVAHLAEDLDWLDEQARPSGGLTIACLGDSTTWGDNGTGAGGPAISWTAHLARFMGRDVAEVRNFGVKGSRIAVTDDRADSFIERWEAYDLDADAIVVFGGVNDFCRAVPLGEPGGTDTRTFYGALDVLIRGILGRYPAARLVFMTPCKTTGRADKGLPGFETANAVGECEEAYAQAVRTVCERYAVPVIDLFATSGISPLMPEHREHYMPDGLHYSPAGYERLARRIAAGLRALL